VRTKLAELVMRHRGAIVDVVLAVAVLAFTLPATATGLSFSVWGPQLAWAEYLVGGLTAAAMLLRRRTPWPMIIMSAVCALLTGQVVPMLLAAYSMTAVHRLPRWTFVALGLTAVYLVVDHACPYTDRLPFFSLVRAFTLVYLPALVGTWVRHYRHAIEEARATALEREEIAASRERRWIARELHDTVTHAVTVMVLSAGIIRETKDLREVYELAGNIEEKGVQALSELRQLLTVLRRDEVPSPGGLEGIMRLAEEAKATGLEVTTHIDVPQGRLPQKVAHACYRIVQEGLNNVRKHAPGSKVRIAVEVRGDELVYVGVINTSTAEACTDAEAAMEELTRVSGPPRGAIKEASEVSGGYGIAGLRERVAILGGRLMAGPTADSGFALAARLPLTPPGESRDSPSSGPEATA